MNPFVLWSPLIAVLFSILMLALRMEHRITQLEERIRANSNILEHNIARFERIEQMINNKGESQR